MTAPRVRLVRCVDDDCCAALPKRSAGPESGFEERRWGRGLNVSLASKVSKVSPHQHHSSSQIVDTTCVDARLCGTGGKTQRLVGALALWTPNCCRAHAPRFQSLSARVLGIRRVCFAPVSRPSTAFSVPFADSFFIYICLF